MARGEESYQGKLLEARQNRLQGRIRPFGNNRRTIPIAVLALGSLVRRSDAQMMTEGGAFSFDHLASLPIMVHRHLWITVVASIFGIKGTQVFRNGGPKSKK